jgi:hypothetical protein
MSHIKLVGFYIAEDGNYGLSPVIVTDLEDLSVSEMEVLTNLPDSSRFAYAEALLTGQDVSEFVDE